MSLNPHRFRNVVYTVFLALCTTAMAASQPMKIEQLWVANSGEVMEAAPITVDLDGDGDLEVMTAAYEHLIVYDGNGKELWQFATSGRLCTYPAILEREGESPLIYLGDGSGQFYCLDGRGKLKWQLKKTDRMSWSAAVIADVDGDGNQEVLQGDLSGSVQVYDALTGVQKWETKIDGACSSPSVGDLDGDGKLEIVVSTNNGKVHALDHTGHLMWVKELGGTVGDWGTSSAVMFGSSAGDVRIVVGARTNRFHCLDSKGNELWSHPTHGPIASTISVGDFDKNGRADIFAVTQLGVIYRYDEDGRILWNIDMQGRSLASGAIIDVDDDGSLEYVICTQKGNLLVLNNSGDVVFSHQFPSRAINVTPAFGDIVRERPGIELVVTGGESGRMYCLGLPGKSDKVWEWRTYRGNNRQTGAWFGLSSTDRLSITPRNLAWDALLTGDAVVFDIVEPSGTNSYRAEAVCVGPDGSRQAAVAKVVGKTGVLQLPIDVTAPGVYRFEWALIDSAGTQVLAGARDVTLARYANDRVLAERAVTELSGVIGSKRVKKRDRGIRGAIQRELDGITRQIAVLARKQAITPGASAKFVALVDSMTMALNARAKRAQALVTVSGPILAKVPDAHVVPFEGTTWENRGVHLQIPTEAAIPLKITRRAVVGEHEPVSVKLFNVTLDPVDITAKVRTDAGGPAVTAFEVKAVPVNANQTGPAWDPLVPLTKRGMSIPSLETREVWLDINLASVKAGTHTIEATFGTGKKAAHVEITLDVLPFDMAGFGAMRLCNWAKYEKNAVEDLLAHNNNVFIYGLPTAKIVSADPLKIEIDFKALDEFVVQLKGWDVFLLMGGQPNMGVKRDDPAYIPRFREYMTQVFARLKTHGIDEKHIALYPHDEPGGAGWDTVKDYIAFGRVALKAYPGLQFYVNGGGGVPMMQALNEVASVWCNGLGDVASGMPGSVFQATTGKTRWSYDCGYGYARPIGVNVKTINVVGQFRMSAINAIGMGITGIGYFCYNHGESMWGPIADEYSLVYVNPDGTTTSSRRWEGVREGMEDARILIALKAKLSDPSVSADAKAKIRHLLDVTIPSVTRQSIDGIVLGVARYVLDATGNDASVAALRREMMESVSAVSAK